MRILLDQDEVITDFVGGACKVWGVPKEKLLELCEPTNWQMKYPLSKLLGRISPMSDEEFWQPINDSPKFWYELEPTPWAFQLIAAVEEITDDWYVVTSPSNCPNCIPGKKQWLHERFRGGFDRIIPTRFKHLFANRRTMLIDDREETVLKFRSEGGMGIVFPHQSNSSAAFVDVALQRVCHLMRGYHALESKKRE